jgi:hypothetical protein
MKDKLLFAADVLLAVTRFVLFGKFSIDGVV